MSTNHHHRSSPFPSCFRPSSAADRGPSTATTTTSPNLTTCLYTTEIGLFALSWCRSTLFGRSLHLHFHHHSHHHFSDINPEEATFHLSIKPFPWSYSTRKGSKKLTLSGSPSARIFYDLSSAKYGSGPEPVSSFYIALVIDGVIALLVGDLEPREAYLKTQRNHLRLQESTMVLRREHIHGTKVYNTKLNVSGRDRSVSIDCKMGPDPKLCFTVDGKRALQIKHLKWKFRGNDSIEIDGTLVQVSWDVYNWLFDGDQDGYALFMFTVFRQEDDSNNNKDSSVSSSSNGMLMWSQPQQQSQHSFGLGFEEKRMKRKKGGAGLRMRSGRSSSSSSLSSALSIGSCSSSVMEWANSEDEEFVGHPYSEFSLLVYAWK